MQMRNESGVVITTVYVESPSMISRPLAESNRNKKVKPNPAVSRKSKVRSQGYDRRAQLLAYTQELRAADNEDDEQSQWNDHQKSKSRHKSKKWKCPTTPRKLGISFLGILRKTKRRWKYQRMPSDEGDNNNNNNNNNNKRNSSGKEKKRGRRKFWRKLKGMFRGLSFAWQRKKG